MKENRFALIYLSIFLMIGICIATAGYWYHKNFVKHIRTDVEKQLTLIADLKVAELVHWLEEQHGDAKTIFGNEVFLNSIKQYFKNPSDSLAKRDIQGWLKQFKFAFSYDAVFLTDTNCKRRISISKEPELPSSDIATIHLDSLKSGRMVFADFYKGKFKNKIFLKILLPVLDSHELMAIIELRVNPQAYLYPLLNSWPVPSETSETFIVSREGSDAVYLTDLRFRKNTALNLRVPLDSVSLPEVRAVLGYEGFVEGQGYYGKAVVAQVKKVPNSPWYLVAQTDVHEAFEAVRKDLWQTVSFAFGIFLIAGMGLGYIWRYQWSRSFTEKLKSAEALQESEERFRILFDKAPLSYQSLDADGNFLDINQTWLETFGYRREEVIGKWFGDFLAKEEVEAFRERFPKFITTGKSHSEFEVIHKNGTKRFISFEGRIAKDTDGNFIQTHGILQDITEQKKSELERQVIFEISHGLTISSNLTELLKLIHHSLGKVVYVENYFVALHDPLTGLFSFPYFEDQFDSVPEPIEMAKSSTAYVFRSGKPFLFTPEAFRQLEEQNEVALIGSYSPSWIGVPLKTPARTIGVLVLQHYEKENVYSERDVQFLDSIGSHIAMAIDRRQAEEELRESEIKLKVILQSTADGILAIDGHGKVIKTNRRFTELWQIPPDLANSGEDQALLNFVLAQLTDPDEFISKVRQLYQSTDEDLDHLHFRDGRIFERFSAPLIMPDESIGRVWSFRDITAARRAEEEIQKRNKELLNLNAEKDKFFSIIAHDLRSPFSSFLGMSQIMAEELPCLSMAEVQDIAISMSKSATNLYRLLENLLQWSQMQQGSIPFRQEIVHLRTIVDESLGMIHESAKIKNIELHTEGIDELYVLADNNMLQTVIRNLLSNAVKFTPGGGKVSLSARASGHQTVEIEVHDSGIGMSPAMVDHLFRIDVKTNRLGTEGEPSTGLGLLLCHEFIEKHGGKIWVKSEVNQGSVFYFSLPEHQHIL